MIVAFTLNGTKVTRDVAPTRTLLDIIRNDFELLGTGAGCRAGECGACLVFLEGELVNSCLVPAFRLQGRSVTTIEGVLKERGYKELKSRLSHDGVFQCDFCRTGIVMTAMYLFAKKTIPRERDIKDALSGNICHCSGYGGLVEAIKEILSSGKVRP
jgi:carbon-monoxide dehydrogenase small subunit